MTARFDLVGIVVADMARSLAFYRRLGIDIPAELDAEPHVDITLPSGIRLAWDTVEVIRSFDSGFELAAGAGHKLELAFACDDAADVDKVHDDLVAAGYESHLAPWDAFWGQRYAVVHDPDGNTVALFAQLPQG
jgi:catechol 2,3-dioxygenase-like lactoylglutathione lyase family enzyme